MERHGLRSYHGLLLHRLCRRHARRRQVCRQGGCAARLFVGHRAVVGRGVPPCLLWDCYQRTVGRRVVDGLRRGAAEPVHVADGGGWCMDGVYRQCLALSGRPLRAGHRGVGKLPGCHYFPKKDRGFATSVFNSGAQIGALLAPFVIPLLARCWGWEMSFLLVGAVGFVWMGVWVYVYDVPQKSKHVNAAELAYIEQDAAVDASLTERTEEVKSAKGISIWKCLTYRQTWAVVAGRFLPDGVWWFFLFWAPAYVHDVYGYSSDSTTGVLLIFTLYLISMLSIIGGYLPTWFVGRKGMNPYAGRMRAMLIYAFFPLIGLVAQPLGSWSYWFPIVIIGIIGAAHQSWSANVYSVVGDMFPKSAVATVTGIGGMSGGIGCLLFNVCSGMLFTYSKETQMEFLGFRGIEAGYMIVFMVASLGYLLSWVIIKLLVPRYQLIEE